MRSVARLLNLLDRVLRIDFCPSANRFVYWLKHPLACLGLAALVSLTCGLLINSYAFALSGVLVGIALLGVIWPRIAVSGLTCDVKFERSRARPGEPVPVRLRIRNRFPWPVWGLSLRRGFFAGDRGRGRGRNTDGIALARVGGWSVSEFVWDFRPATRGSYPFESP